MSDQQQAQLPAVRPDLIRPYASAVILEYTGQDPDTALPNLSKKLRELKVRTRSSRKVEIIASGLALPEPDLHAQPVDANDPDSSIDLDGFICQITAPPSWAFTDSPFNETRFDLVVILGRRRLVAIRCDSSLAEAIQHWLDRSPKPPWRRIPPGVINAALLTGEAKGLWLRGTHVRRTTKADAKNMSGRRLQEALSPLEDSSFSMGSARVDLPSEEAYGSLEGTTIGTTPRKSLVWISATADFLHFVSLIRDLLQLLESALVSGTSVDSPYPWLATELRSLSGVTNAYEITTLSVEEIPRTPDWPEEAIQAAGFLQRVNFSVLGNSSDANFVAEVSLDGSIRGRIECVVEEDNGQIRLVFGWDALASPLDEPSVREILSALQYSDLLTVYYESGHAISGGSVWSAVVRDSPFPNWDWRDFAGFDIRREKPPGSSPQDIHDAIAEKGDVSLFAWVVNFFGEDGWLTCDDGAGEIADFIKYDGDGSLSLIHVKAATSANPGRPVNVTSYETVVSQAAKNLTYLNTESLIRKLATPSVARPACWYKGHRVDGRAEMIEFLGIRPAQAPSRVMVIQPQMTRARYAHTVSTDDGSIDRSRLKLLETMLNAARGAVTGLGADLQVIASS